MSASPPDPPSGFVPAHLRRGFAATIFVVVIGGVLALEVGGGNVPFGGADEKPSLEGILSGKAQQAAEKGLQARSAAARALRPGYNELLWLLLGEATPKVLVAEPRLFEPETVKGYPPPEAAAIVAEHVALIAALDAWFRRQGVALLCLPVPNRSSFLAHRLPVRIAPPPDFTTGLVRELRRRGVRTLDVPAILAKLGEGAFLPNDSHWSWIGADAVAAGVAGLVDEDEGLRVPGTRTDILAIIREPCRYRGDLQRMLGFAADSAVDRRFTANVTRVAAVPRRAAESAAPIGDPGVALFGTSFSHSLGFGSLLAAHLRRAVEDRSLPARGPLIRLEERIRQFLGGKAKLPALIVWEFPEKHLFRRRAEFLHPLRRLVDELGGAMEYDAARADPLEYVRRDAVHVELTATPDGAIAGRPATADPGVAYILRRPIPADGRHAITWRQRVAEPGVAKVYFDTGAGFAESGARSAALAGGAAFQRLVVPVPDIPGGVVRALRIDPVNRMVPFEIADVEILRLRP